MEDRYGYVTAQVYTDPDSYERTVYEDLFLGSQGKRVGSLYAGVDDFAVYTPKFDTSFTYTTPYETRSGSFQQALCFPEYIQQRDWFNGNPYVYYSAETSASPPSSMRVTPTDRLWFSCGSPFPAP